MSFLVETIQFEGKVFDLFQEILQVPQYWSFGLKRLSTKEILAPLILTNLKVEFELCMFDLI